MQEMQKPVSQGYGLWLKWMCILQISDELVVIAKIVTSQCPGGQWMCRGLLSSNFYPTASFL